MASKVGKTARRRKAEPKVEESDLLDIKLDELAIELDRRCERIRSEAEESVSKLTSAFFARLTSMTFGARKTKVGDVLDGKAILVDPDLAHASATPGEGAAEAPIAAVLGSRTDPLNGASFGGAPATLRRPKRDGPAVNPPPTAVAAVRARPAIPAVIPAPAASSTVVLETPSARRTRPALGAGLATPSGARTAVRAHVAPRTAVPSTPLGGTRVGLGAFVTATTGASALSSDFDFRGDEDGENARVPASARKGKSAASGAPLGVGFGLARAATVSSVAAASDDGAAADDAAVSIDVDLGDGSTVDITNPEVQHTLSDEEKRVAMQKLQALQAQLAAVMSSLQAVE